MLTLHSLLRQPDLGLAVVTGSGDLDREVRWVHVTELPDPRPYVGDGELVATNGLWAAHCSCAVFVRRLHECGAVGLAFGLREDCEQVPAELGKACAEHGLPLLAVPPSVPFTALTQAVAAAQLEERRTPLLNAVRRTDELTAALASGGGMRGLINLLGRRQGAPIALVDRLGRVPVSTFGPLASQDSMSIPDALNAGVDGDELVLADGTRGLLMAVRDFGRAELALWYGRPPESVAPAEREALDQAIRFLSVELAQRRAVRSVEARFAGEVLDMILDGSARAGELASRLRSFGIDARSALQVLSLAEAQTQVHEAGTRTGTGSGSGSEAETAALEELVGEFFLERGMPCVICSADGETVVIVGVRGYTTRVRALADELLGAVRARMPRRGHVVGVGRTAEDYQGLRNSLLQAREARRLAQDGRHDGAVAMFSSAASYRLLLSLLDEEARRDFVRGVLAPVAAYDQEHAGELQHTLRVFFQEGESWKRTAAQLHIHVNTLRNRLGRIEQLSGRSVGEVEDRTDLFLALEISAGLPEGELS